MLASFNVFSVACTVNFGMLITLHLIQSKFDAIEAISILLLFDIFDTVTQRTGEKVKIMDSKNIYLCRKVIRYYVNIFIKEKWIHTYTHISNTRNSRFT